MGDIRLSVGQINITGHLLIIIKEQQNPGAEVDRLSVPPPVPSVQNIVFSGLNDVVHLVEFRESPDGTALGVLLSMFVYDVGSGIATSEMRFYTVDGPGTYDPLAGATSITDPYLNGKNVTKVFKEGFRFLKNDIEFSQAGATLTLLPSAQVLNAALSSQETISVEIAFTTQGSTSTTASAYPKDVIAVPSNIILDNTHYNCMLEATAGGGILTITLPTFGTIPDGIKFSFNTDNGSQRYLTIALPPGNYCMVEGKQRGAIYMGRGEQLQVIKKGNYLRIISWDGDHKRVGYRVSGDQKPPINSLPEIGGWYLKSDYPRIWEWYINELPPADILYVADDTPLNLIQGAKWAVGTTKFWVPDRRGFTDKIASGVRTSGDVEGPQVGAFELTLTKANGFTGNPGGADVNKFAYGSANPAPRSLLVNAGLENRVLNAAVFSYRII